MRGHSVKGMLQGAGTATFAAISAQKRSQEAWAAWLQDHLPEELRTCVRGAVERAGVLTVFTESAAWSTRVRFALGELDREIKAEQPAITRVLVRVTPSSG